MTRSLVLYMPYLLVYKCFWPCAQCSVYLNCNEPAQISHCYGPALLSGHPCGLVAATEF